jgi:hypothetical protein
MIGVYGQGGSPSALKRPTSGSVWPQVFRLFPSIVQRRTGVSLNDSYTGIVQKPGYPRDEMLKGKQDRKFLDIRFLRKPVDSVMAHVEWDHGISVSRPYSVLFTDLQKSRKFHKAEAGEELPSPNFSPLWRPSVWTGLATKNSHAFLRVNGLAIAHCSCF